MLKSSQFERIGKAERVEQLLEILNSRVIGQFIREHADAEAPLMDWVAKTKAAVWKNNSDVQKTFNRVDHLGSQKFIFNIGGNNFRMVAMVWIENERVYVLKIMTHAEYDREKF
ncbi:MAG TPA: type II toxin-antitoxin system HigB family toxin [Oculatellaceae cyanobacterium]